jgi:ferritin-like metal-binding protein YciE
MKIESLTDLFIEELRDLYDGEQQLLKALPKMAEASFSEELRESFLRHADETREHVDRLESIFEKLKTSGKGRRCHGMAGLLAEADELLENERGADPNALDAGLIVAAQKVEHYEIAGYGSARTFAETLGARDAEALLQRTLQEEMETDRRLTILAESAVNLDAAEADTEIFDEAGQPGQPRS